MRRLVRSWIQCLLGHWLARVFSRVQVRMPGVEVLVYCNQWILAGSGTLLCRPASRPWPGRSTAPNSSARARGCAPQSDQPNTLVICSAMSKYYHRHTYEKNKHQKKAPMHVPYISDDKIAQY